MKSVMKKICFAFLCFANLAFADVIDKIEFVGLGMVEEAALSDCVHIKPGQQYDSSDLNTIFNKLYSKGFFSSIQFTKKDNVLKIYCVENPLVCKVAFNGNDALNNDMMKNIIRDRIGELKLFNKHVLRSVLSDLQEAYNALGYCSVVIKPMAIYRGKNKIDIEFVIDEGDKSVVKKITFVGNASFGDEDLKNILSTKESRLWRFWDRDSQVYREDKVAADIEALGDYYKNRGYPNFSVTSVTAEKSFDNKSFYCTFILEEGHLFKLGDVSLRSEVAAVNSDNFVQYINIKKGETYNEAAINYDREYVRKKIGLDNHPFVDVERRIDLDKKNKIANVTYVIVKTPKTFIERIEISGNLKTFDKVIRREMDVHEGDPFNVQKVKDGINRLNGVGFFESVNVSDEPGSSSTKKNIIIQVQEKENSASMKGGVTLNDSDGFGGLVGINDINFLGTGCDASADVYWMQKHYGCSVGLFDPYFMDQNFGAGINIGGYKVDRKKTDSSKTQSIFLAPYITYKMSKSVYHKIQYSASFSKKQWVNRRTGEVRDSIPEEYQDLILGEEFEHSSSGPAKYKDYIINEEFGKYTSCELKSVIKYDHTDNVYDPRGGYDVSLINAYAGIGGDVRYFLNKLGMNYYYLIAKQLTFVTSFEVGHVHEISNTRSCDRFVLGGEIMRGFDYGGVGPRDKFDNAIGGNKFWTLSFVLKRPLSSKEIGINGVAFIDLGSAWGSKFEEKRKINDSSAIRASAGIAIEWVKSPLGMPMTFVFGFPIKKTAQDQKQTFTFTGMM